MSSNLKVQWVEAYECECFAYFLSAAHLHLARTHLKKSTRHHSLVCRKTRLIARGHRGPPGTHSGSGSRCQVLPCGRSVKSGVSTYQTCALRRRSLRLECILHARLFMIKNSEHPATRPCPQTWHRLFPSVAPDNPPCRFWQFSSTHSFCFHSLEIQNPERSGSFSHRFLSLSLFDLTHLWQSQPHV